MALPSPNQPIIVIVDDDLDLLPSLVEIVKQLSDYDVATADNGIDGLERIFATHPICAVIDVKMPGLDGYQLARALRGDPETADIPLIILTAMIQDKDRFLGLAAGVDQYLLKPIRPLELMHAIESSIQLSQVERARRLHALAEEPLPEL